MEDFKGLNLKSQELKMLLETYDPYMQAVAKNKTDFTDEQAGKLAIMLGNTERAFAKMNESTQVPQVGGEFKKHAMAMISATFPNLIAEELVSVQPMALKIAQIFYLKYVYGTSKGNVKKGDIAFDRFGAPTNKNFNYSNEVIDEEVIGEGDGTVTDFEANLAFIPVRAGSVNIVAGALTIKDDGNGKLKASGLANDGTIDYSSGKVVFKVTTAIADGVEVEASYEADFEFAPANSIPELDLKVEETTVKARARKLKTLFAFDAGYDMQMSHGIDIDSALMEAAVQSIKNEVDGEILNDLYNQAGLTSTWNKVWNPMSGISSRDYALSFLDEIVSASHAMLTATRRTKPNFLVVGKWGADTLAMIGAPRFVHAGNQYVNGTYFMGTLDGGMKVYHNPYFNDNQYLLGYKGTSLIDAGYAYCPYLPIMNTQALMMEDFLNRRGYATSYGKKMLVPNVYIKGTITNTNN